MGQRAQTTGKMFSVPQIEPFQGFSSVGVLFLATNNASLTLETKH
jgi:hypothetical protein